MKTTVVIRKEDLEQQKYNLTVAARQIAVGVEGTDRLDIYGALSRFQQEATMANLLALVKYMAFHSDHLFFNIAIDALVISIDYEAIALEAQQHMGRMPADTDKTS